MKFTKPVSCPSGILTIESPGFSTVSTTQTGFPPTWVIWIPRCAENCRWDQRRAGLRKIEAADLVCPILGYACEAALGRDCKRGLPAITAETAVAADFNAVRIVKVKSNGFGICHGAGFVIN